MIILFGSHARGDWVADSYVEDHITYTYVSDYDILVVTEKKKSPSFEGFLESKVERLADGSGIMRTPVSVISHDIKFVNRKLEEGKYFFCDIKKEGIMLYDSGKYKLAVPKPINPEQRQKRMRKDFKHWFEHACHFLDTFQFCCGKKYYNEAAFLLHQATENLYHTVLLVFTGYKPKLHNIEKLEKKAAVHNKRFHTPFPKTTKEEKRLFTLLKEAYVRARYDMNYSITPEELEYLSGRVEILRDLTEELCKEEISRTVKK
jgi:HEPN domain-containing protein/predicted nucleotidyltransferase